LPLNLACVHIVFWGVLKIMHAASGWPHPRFRCLYMEVVRLVNLVNFFWRSLTFTKLTLTSEELTKFGK
jgi:hypothetical protein